MLQAVRLLTEMARTSDNGPRGDAVAAQASNSTIEGKKNLCI